MTNREKLLKTSEYDTLVKMNVNLRAKIGVREHCIIDVLRGQASRERCRIYSGCRECIADWLNEEVE